MVRKLILIFIGSLMISCGDNKLYFFISNSSDVKPDVELVVKINGDIVIQDSFVKDSISPSFEYYPINVSPYNTKFLMEISLVDGTCNYIDSIDIDEVTHIYAEYQLKLAISNSSLPIDEDNSTDVDTLVPSRFVIKKSLGELRLE